MTPRDGHHTLLPHLFPSEPLKRAKAERLCGTRHALSVSLRFGRDRPNGPHGRLHYPLVEMTYSFAGYTMGIGADAGKTHRRQPSDSEGTAWLPDPIATRSSL